MKELSHPQGFEPYKYQLKAIRKGINMRRFINGDDMGLGKTLESIATIEALQAHPALIICPASVKINWKEEIEAWTNHGALILNNKHVHSWHFYMHPQFMGGMFYGQFKYFIVNYDSLKKFFVYKYLKPKPKLKDIVFNPYIRYIKTVVVDEAHLVNNPDSQRTKLVAGLSHKKENIMLLTGTPIVNSEKDLIAPLAIMDRMHEFGDRFAFAETYKDGNNTAALQSKLSRFYFRREKKDVLLEMPDKFRSVLKIPITTATEYNLAVDDLEAYFRTFTNKNEFEIDRSMRGKAMVLVATLKRISAIGKIQGIKEVVKNILIHNQKVILFMDRLELIAEFKNIFPQAVTITGADNIRARRSAQRKFQEDPNCQIIICSIKAAGVGLNLMAADNVLFVEYWWTYATMVQCEDRAYRNGRKDNVNCIWTEGNGTIDYYIRSVIFGKKDLLEKATGAKDYTVEKSQDLLLKELMININKLKLVNT